MGYHTYNLAEFDVKAVGRHSTYLLFFSERCSAKRFAEHVGNDAVSISNGVKTIDWMFRNELPSWMAERFYEHSTILVASHTKTNLNLFLTPFKAIDKWRSDSMATFDVPPKPSIEFTAIPELAIFIVPELSRDAVAVDVIAELVKTGLVRDALRNNLLSDLSKRIEEILDIDTHVFKNVVFVDTVKGDWESKSRHSVAEELFAELSSIKKLIMESPQNKNTNALLRELSLVRKEIARADEQKTPLSLQASVGFEAFGNGLKVVFDSDKRSISVIESVRRLFARFKIKTEHS